MILIYQFGYRLNLFPIIGMHTIGKENELADFLAHFTLPYITLTVAFFPELTRYIRASANEQITEDYVTVQSAFQATRWEIFSRHISRNILIPIVTQIGLAGPAHRRGVHRPELHGRGHAPGPGRRRPDAHAHPRGARAQCRRRAPPRLLR